MKRLITALIAAVALALPQNADASVTFQKFTFANSSSFNCTSSPCTVPYTPSTTGGPSSPVSGLAFTSVTGTCTMTTYLGGATQVTTFSSSASSSLLFETFSTGGLSYQFSGCTVSGTLYYN